MLFIGLLAATATTCRAVPQPSEPFPADCRHEVRYWIDPEFTPEQSLVVVQSVYAWKKATEKRICFSLSPEGGLRIHRTHHPDDVREIENRGAQSSGGHPDKVVGLASYPDAYVLTDKLRTEQDLFATSTHEFGHLLGLDHYEPEKTCHTSSFGLLAPEPSWMYPSIDRDPQDSREVTPRDMRALFMLDRWK